MVNARTQKYLGNMGALCNIVRRMAVEAGEITLKYYDGLEDAQVTAKQDGSLVSLADQEAEAYIQKALADLTPDIPFVGEESAAAGQLPDLKQEDYFWLVDPLDGTREFVNGSEDFTVNIALIHKGAPVMGVVYIPVTGVLYAGHAPGTAVRWSEDTGKDKSIKVRIPPKAGLTVVASKSHGDQERLEQFLNDFKINKIIKRGSSLKICAVAEGRADIYPRLGPTCEWDTGAADAVLRAAGGMITDTKGKPLIYGGADPKFLNPEFVASAFEWF